MKDSANAFIDCFKVPGNAEGELSGLTFGSKDIYDITGKVTGCGNPTWTNTHAPAKQNAPAVQALLDAGATLLGKTHTDELAYSLMGVNSHYGTPTNSAAPDRVPGGSSSGSAAATAAGLIDIGLGSDTGGSVRLPASFCGLFGIRTTHGRLSLEGAMPLAPSFDTVGWFARDAQALVKTGIAYGVFSKTGQDIPQNLRLMIADDGFERAYPKTAVALTPALLRLQELFSESVHIKIAEDSLTKWRETFQVCQASEIWQQHGEWITNVQPEFGPGVKQRFEMAATISNDSFAEASGFRSILRNRMQDLLGEDGLIAIPSSPGPAPLRTASENSLNDFRQLAMELLSPAGLAGVPQINLPAGKVEGAPVGLSLIAPAGREDLLLAIASRWQLVE